MFETKPERMGWGLPDDEASWSPVSSLILMLAALLYWSAAWLSAGLPPLAFLASRRLRRHTEMVTTKRSVEAITQ